MDEGLRQDMVAKMRIVKDTLRICDGNRRSVVMPGEIINLAAYGHRLELAYENNDSKDARHLLAAIF